MKEIGLLFKPEMILAVERRNNPKTQTRRLVSRPKWAASDCDIELGTNGRPYIVHTKTNRLTEIRCPYGSAHDHLWTRETWQHSNFPHGPYDARCDVFYRADYLDDVHGPDGELSPEGRYRFWKPAIHQPRSASRRTLRNLGVRVERLQEISDADALAEGIYQLPDGGFKVARGWQEYDTAVDAYAAYIDHINGAGTWATNPWVWAIKFEKVIS